MKRLPVMFAILCLASCADLPVADNNRLDLSAGTGELPPETQVQMETADLSAELAEDAEAAETDETARGLHGLVKIETDEPEISRPIEPAPEFLSGLSEPPEPPVQEPLPAIQEPALPVVQEPEPPVIKEPVPSVREQPAPQVPAVQEPPVPPVREQPVREQPRRPPPPPPIAREPAVREPPAPPPVPEFIRPSQPPPPPEKESERPFAAIPDLPALPRSLSGDKQNYSRTVNAFTGQYVEIPFRGPGWVYLGELGSRRGVSYDSRRLDSEGMVFVFRADEEGSYSLRFNRQDFIRDFIINDYVKVIVQAAPEITGSVWHSTAVTPDRVYAAPRWPPANGLRSGLPLGGEAQPAAETLSQPETPLRPEAPLQQEAPLQPAGSASIGNAAPTGSAVSTGNAVPTGSAAPTGSAGQEAPGGPRAGPSAQSAAVRDTETAPPEASVPGDYLSRAQEEYEAGRIAGALGVLDRFSLAYPGGSDEAYWLYGQALEVNGPNRDIRLALDYYRRLVREYPQSGRYDAARRRIAYLERFYFDIR